MKNPARRTSAKIFISFFWILLLKIHYFPPITVANKNIIEKKNVNFVELCFDIGKNKNE